MLLAIFDLADRKKNFWSTMSAANEFAAVVAIMMTAVAIISLTYRVSPKTPSRFNWDGAALIAMYLGAMVVLYWIG